MIAHLRTCRRASSLPFFVRPGACRSSVFPAPIGACGTTGRSRALGRLHERPRKPVIQAPVCRLRGSTHGLPDAFGFRRAWHTGVVQRLPTGPGPGRSPRLRSARGWIFRLAACPQELSLLSTRRLVRADCRPDMHLDRPPDPASLFELRRACPLRAFKRFAGHARRRFVALVPAAPGRSIRNPQSFQARHRSGHRIQPCAMKTVMTRPSPGLDV